MHVLILGAGYSGTAIAKAMAPTATSVIGTTRSEEKAAKLERAGIRPVLFDGETMDDGGKLEPFRRTDRRASDGAKRHRQRIGDPRDLGIALDHLVDRQLHAEFGIVQHIHAVAAERRNGAAGPDDGDKGTIGHGSSSRGCDRASCPPGPTSSACGRSRGLVL